MRKILRYLSPPERGTFEQSQKARILHFTLLVTTFTALPIAFINIELGDLIFANILFSASALSLVGVVFNHLGYQTLSAAILTVIVYLSTFSTIITGNGFEDPGVVAIPIFIIFTGFLIERHGVRIAAGLSLLSIAGIYSLSQMGAIQYERPPVLENAIIIGLLVIAISVVTQVIFNSWRNSLLRIREAYDKTLQGWAKLVAYRDREIGEHNQRVVRMCTALGREMGLSPEQIAHLQRGAMLHDIGKLAIPDDVLQKKGPLSSQDRTVMMDHPNIARDVLSDVEYLAPALSIPQYHHERWDGGGYPDGLQGEQIPLQVRIFTLVDHWDALNSKRPYREAWEREKVLAYIKENEGKIFDPAVTAAFFRLLDKGLLEAID